MPATTASGPNRYSTSRVCRLMYDPSAALSAQAAVTAPATIRAQRTVARSAAVSCRRVSRSSGVSMANSGPMSVLYVPAPSTPRTVAVRGSRGICQAPAP